MALWGSQDANSNSVLWAPAKVSLAPNTANRDNLFGNTTADAFVTGQTIGQFGVDDAEIKVQQLSMTSAVINNAGTGGSYVPGEIIYVDGTGSTHPGPNSSVKIISTAVRTVTLVANGQGYAANDKITLSTGSGNPVAVINVTAVNAGNISTIALVSGGTYLTNPTLSAGGTTALTGAGNSATITVTMKMGSIAMNDPGEYSVAPSTTTGAATSGSASGTGGTLDVVYTGQSKGINHTGWNFRTVGSGGRSGRVQWETLVAGGISSDASDDTVLPDS